MANKDHYSEKDIKNYYKTEISRLEKELNSKDHTIYDLRCQLRSLQNKLKTKGTKSTPKPVKLTDREAAIKKAKEVRDKMGQKNKPQEES